MAKKQTQGIGSVTQRDHGTWRLRWTSYDQHGNPEHHTVECECRNKTSAKQRLAELRQHHNLLHDTGPTLTEALQTHIDRGLKGHVGECHQIDIAGIQRLYIAPSELGSKPINLITTGDIEEFLTEAAKRVGRKGQTLSRSRVNRIKIAISGAYVTQTRLNNFTGEHPTKHVRMPAINRPAPTVEVPAVGDVQAAILRADEVRDGFGLFIRLLVVTAARRGEMCGIIWSDIDWIKQRITIRRSISQPSGKGLLVKPTKTGDVRTLDLDVGTLQELEQWHNKLGRPSDTHFVFGGSAPPWPNRFSIAWDQLRKVAGISERTRLHDLRHYVASSMLEEGIDIAKIANRLGHSKVETTMGNYIHIINADQQHADSIIDKLKLPAPGKARREPGHGEP